MSYWGFSSNKVSFPESTRGGLVFFTVILFPWSYPAPTSTMIWLQKRWASSSSSPSCAATAVKTLFNCYLRQLFCNEYVSLLLLSQLSHSMNSMAEPHDKIGKVESPHARQSAVYIIKYFHWRRSGWTRYLIKLFLLVFVII